MTLLLVATGDTIAHRAAAVATGRELLELAGPPPERVVVEDVLAEPSWDTSVATQLALARRGPQGAGGRRVPRGGGAPGGGTPPGGAGPAPPPAGRAPGGAAASPAAA